LQGKIEFDIDIIIDEYSNYVYKIINNIIGDALPYSDKEEVASDTFYLLWKNSHKIKTNLKSYLGTIAKNCAYEKLRNSKNNFEYNDTLENIIVSDFTELIIVKEKIKRLSIEEQQLFKLYYLDGLKIKEISKILKINIGTLKIRLFRIRKKLKEDK